MKCILITIFLLLPILCVGQNTLVVEVVGVKNSEGKISVAVYNKAEEFLKLDKVYRASSIQAEKGITRLTIEDLLAGEYALAIIHDKNGNDILDTNWIGIPKEPVGFSNAKMRTFGPPGFKDCGFKINSDYEISITL